MLSFSTAQSTIDTNMDWFLFSWLIFSFSSTNAINQTVYATRILNNGRPPPSRSLTDEQEITFFMQDVLANSNPTPGQVNAGADARIPPFPKPNGLFPPKDGVPFPRPVDTTLGQGLPFVTNLQALELGMVSVIDEVLTDGYLAGSPTVGKVRGITVTSSEGSDGLMIAMTASFDENGEPGDSLRFFGLHHAGASESHIAVIGGTGKYHEANGFAAVRNVVGKGLDSSNRSLLVTVHLK